MNAGGFEPKPWQRLKPWAALHRLRPIRTAALAGHLREYSRTVSAVRLLAQHVPAALAAYPDLSGRPLWWDLLADLINSAEELDWFEADWELLNLAWAGWMEGAEAGDESDGNKMAAFLRHIPVKLYGLTPGAVLASPPIELFHALLSDQVQAVSAELLIALEIYDTHFEDVWSAPERTQAWQRLQAIEADPGRFPEPVRWLPELARWACHTTGNPLLDLALPPQLHLDSDWPPVPFTWDDLETVRVAWRRAKPVIAQLERLETWLKNDESRFIRLFEFFKEGKYDDEFNW
jgi:hypothetical protein